MARENKLCMCELYTHVLFLIGSSNLGVTANLSLPLLFWWLVKKRHAVYFCFGLIFISDFPLVSMEQNASGICYG